MGKWKVSGSGWSSFLMGRYLAGPADERSPAELKHGAWRRAATGTSFQRWWWGGLKENAIILKMERRRRFLCVLIRTFTCGSFESSETIDKLLQTRRGRGGGVSPLNQQTARPAQGWTESDSLTPPSPLTPPWGQLHPRQRWEVRGDCVLAAGPQQSVRLLLNESSTLLPLLPLLLLPLFALLLLLLLLILLLTDSLRFFFLFFEWIFLVILIKVLQPLNLFMVRVTTKS